MRSEKFDDFLRVFRVSFETERKRFYPLQEQKSVEGRDRRAGVAQEDRPHIGDEGGGTHRVHKGNAMVAGIGFGDGGVFAAGLPVELAGVHDDAAQRCAVAAQELGITLLKKSGKPIRLPGCIRQVRRTQMGTAKRMRISLRMYRGIILLLQTVLFIFSP